MLRCCGRGPAHPPRPRAAVRGPARGASPGVGPVARSDTGFPFNSSLPTKTPGKQEVRLRLPWQAGGVFGPCQGRAGPGHGQSDPRGEFSLGDRQYCPNHPPRWCCPHRAPLTSAHRACQLFSRPKGGAISRHLAPSRWYQHGFSDPKKYRLRRKPVPEKNTACGAHATRGAMPAAVSVLTS